MAAVSSRTPFLSAAPDPSVCLAANGVGSRSGKVTSTPRDCTVCGVRLDFRSARSYENRDLCPACLTKLTDETGEDASPSVVEGANLQAGAPQGAGVIRYLREAIRIGRFDAEAMERVSRDTRALIVGAGVLAVGTAAVMLPTLSRSMAELREVWIGMNPGSQDVPGAFVFLFVCINLVLGILMQLVLSAVQVAILHGAAKVLFGATGSYPGLLRVLWLGNVVMWLGIVPMIGWIIGGIWLFLITLVTFEEVDGIERLQAFGLAVLLSAITGVAMMLSCDEPRGREGRNVRRGSMAACESSGSGLAHVPLDTASSVEQSAVARSQGELRRTRRFS